MSELPKYNEENYPYDLPFDNKIGKDVFRDVPESPILPDVDADFKEKNCYKRDINLKAANVHYPYTQEHIDEIKKCKNDIFYFILNYVKIVTLDDGIKNFELYQYQKNMIKIMDENRFCIFTTSRQAGKCVTEDTEITIRKKSTGEIEKIKIGDFYKKLKSPTEIINS